MIYLEETGFEDDTTHGGRVLKMEEFLHLPLELRGQLLGCRAGSATALPVILVRSFLPTRHSRFDLKLPRVFSHAGVHGC